MLQVRCQKCGWNQTVGRDMISNIMEEIQESNPTHYTLDCPKCRHRIKVQTRLIKRVGRFLSVPSSADEEPTSTQES
jgi:DNA-directed RNA polymerase subunit RPC12/RpoP